MKTAIIPCSIMMLSLMTSCSNSNETPSNQNINQTKNTELAETKNGRTESNTELNSGDRIQSIKAMYAEVTTLENNRKHYNCKKGKTIEKVDLGMDLPPRDLEQLAEYCEFSNGYALYKGNLRGYEWGEDCTYYLKDGKLFFAFISFGAESCFGEYRLYYDENEKIIQVLVKAGNCYDEDLPTPSDRIPQEEKERIIKDMTANYKKIKAMVK